MSPASRSLRSTTTKPATTTPSTAAPTNAATASTAASPPEIVSRKIATIGNERLSSWFQSPVRVTARVTRRVANPQLRSIANDVATPAAIPAGTTSESAVETCVTTVAWTNDSPGSATIQGGAKVATLSTAAPTSTAIHTQESSWTTSHTSR